jgi:general secretion pathway protein C
MIEFSHKQLRTINIVIIVLIFLALLLCTRKILAFSLESVSYRKTIVNEQKQSDDSDRSVHTIMMYAPVAERNPFGAPVKFQPAGNVQTVHRSQRPFSDLLLFGTVTGPDDLSYAIFADKSQTSAGQELFAFGEDVYDYGRLTEIREDSVELTRGTEKHTIPIVEDPVPGKGRSGPGRVSGVRSDLARQINEKQYLLNQEKVLEALNKPEQILSDARLYPNIKDGNQEGFRVLEVKRGGIYEDLGLKNRDVLLRINGLNLKGPESAMQAMSALKGMNTINLDIIRNGENMTLTYQIR